MSKHDVDLKLDWCSHAAAKYAVEKWHYSRRCPIGKSVLIGVWENDEFIGVVWFARGAAKDMVAAYGLVQTEACELVRVALRRHITPVSRIVAVALKLLKRRCPLLRLCVSYADPEHGHHGGIYQGGNWCFAGDSAPSVEWLHGGRWKHNREMTGGAFGRKRRLASPALPRRKRKGKHKYLYPFDEAMRKQIEPLRKPYPKRAGSADSGTSADQAEGGGATPTSALSRGKSKQ